MLLQTTGGRQTQPERFSGELHTCRAALKLQKGISARSLNFLNSGSFMVCCSVSHPTSASGSLISILHTSALPVSHPLQKVPPPWHCDGQAPSTLLLVWLIQYCAQILQQPPPDTPEK